MSLEREHMPLRLLDITAFTIAASACGESVFPESSLLSIAEKYGVIAALLVFFVWRDFTNQKEAKEREQALIQRINLIEDRQAADRNTVIEENTKALHKVATVIEGCHRQNR